MKKNLEIIDFEDKTTKAGKPYNRFKTNEGWVSCFDVKSCEMLRGFKGKSASVEMLRVENKEKPEEPFFNLKKCYGEAGNEDAQVEVVKIGDTKASNNKNATMYTSYAKDIFCASLEHYRAVEMEMSPDMIMKESVILVKQAKEAFE